MCLGTVATHQLPLQLRALVLWQLPVLRGYPLQTRLGKGTLQEEEEVQDSS